MKEAQLKEGRRGELAPMNAIPTRTEQTVFRIATRSQPVDGKKKATLSKSSAKSGSSLQPVRCKRPSASQKVCCRNLFYFAFY
jgi:hypothetical protein